MSASSVPLSSNMAGNLPPRASGGRPPPPSLATPRATAPRFSTLNSAPLYPQVGAAECTSERPGRVVGAVRPGRVQRG